MPVWIATALRIAPWALFALAIAWAGWERNGRKDADLALLNQKNQELSDANAAWKKVDEARDAFDAQVASGLAKLNEKQRQMEAANDAYQAAVRADSGGKTLLTPTELAALKLLSNAPAVQAGGSALRGASQPAPVR